MGDRTSHPSSDRKASGVWHVLGKHPAPGNTKAKLCHSFLTSGTQDRDALYFLGKLSWNESDSIQSILRDVQGLDTGLGRWVSPNFASLDVHVCKPHSSLFVHVCTPHFSLDVHVCMCALSTSHCLCVYALNTPHWMCIVCFPLLTICARVHCPLLLLADSWGSCCQDLCKRPESLAQGWT